MKRKQYIIRNVNLRSLNKQRILRSSKYLVPIICRLKKKRLNPKYFKVKDQDGSTCLTTCLTYCIEYLMRRQNNADNQEIELSPMFIHYNSYADEGLTSHQIFKKGLSFAEFLESVNNFGMIQEYYFEYNIKEINLAKVQMARIGSETNRIAKWGTIKKTKSKRVLELIKILIAQEIPVMITVPVSRETEENMTYPTGRYDYVCNFGAKTDSHSITLVGFDNKTETFTYLNTWGDDWGKDGYQQMPYSYVHDIQKIVPSQCSIVFIVSIVCNGNLYSLEESVPKLENINIITEIRDAELPKFLITKN